VSRRGLHLAALAALSVAAPVAAANADVSTGASPAPAVAPVDETEWAGPDGLHRRLYRPRFVPAPVLLDGLGRLGVGGFQALLDASRGRLLLVGEPAALPSALEALDFLDVAPPQVLVEVVVAETLKTSRRERGSAGTFDRTGSSSSSAFRGVRWAFEPESWIRSRLVADRPFQGASAAFAEDVDDGAFAGAFDAVLRGMATEGEVDLLACPSVVCTEGIPSKITSTVELPLARWEESAGVTKITFPTEHAGVTLDVTAEHVGTDHVTLVVHPWVRQVSALEHPAGPEGVPVLSAREASTTVTLADRRSAVIGGVGTRHLLTDRQSAPWLDRLPALDGLLAARGDECATTELLIVVRPTILVAGRGEPPNLPPGEDDRLARRPRTSRARLAR
jgi:type II secretory pathway component GspD/PulD (secretin)